MKFKPKTSTYSFDELKDFIFSQKDDRIIDMFNMPIEETGCILVHFGRKKIKRKILCVGFSSIEDDRGKFYMADSEKIVSFIKKAVFLKIKNYKEAKKLLNKFLK
jgi:hypothetical protein